MTSSAIAPAPPSAGFSVVMPNLAYPFAVSHASNSYVSRKAIEAATIAMSQVAPENAATASGAAPKSGAAAKLDSTVIAVLDHYVRHAQAGEDRLTARRRIEMALLSTDSDVKLALNNLGLLEVPPVIPLVRSLDLSGNRLDHLPPLPCDIKNLNLANNRFKELPANLPSELRVLNVSRNYLKTLPETLPNQLEHVDARDNGLSALPKMLPNQLRQLDVAQNRANLVQEAARRTRELSLHRVTLGALRGPLISASSLWQSADAKNCSASLDAHAVYIRSFRLEQ